MDPGSKLGQDASWVPAGDEAGIHQKLLHKSYIGTPLQRNTLLVESAAKQVSCAHKFSFLTTMKVIKVKD